MKTESDIRTDIYGLLKDSELATFVDGKLYRRQRPTNSTSEDICIGVVESNISQNQGASVNVIIYVPDVLRGKDYIESPRIAQIERVAMDLLEHYAHPDGWSIDLERQSVYEITGTQQHAISNRLQYKTNTEL